MIGIDRLKRDGDGIRLLQDDIARRERMGFVGVEDMDRQFDIFQRMYA
jgi:hypothetical protein